MVLPKFIKAALLDQPLVIYGNGEQTRCFADVSDVWGIYQTDEYSWMCRRNIQCGNHGIHFYTDLAKKVKEDVP